MESFPIYESMALIAAVCWGANAVLVRLGLETSNATTGAVVSISGNAVVIVILTLTLVEVRQHLALALLFFVASGLLQPGLVRTLTYWSYGRIGVARTQPIRSSSPLITVVLAIFVLGEQPTLTTLLGAFVVVIGVVFASFERSESPRTWRRRDLAMPIAASCLAGISYTLRKAGLMHVPVPLLAACITTSTSWVTTFGGVMLISGGRSLRINKNCLIFFGLSAAVTSIGQVLTFYALRGGDLSRVSPLSSTTPLWGILFASIFLREMERVTTRTAISGLAVVAGIILIML